MAKRKSPKTAPAPSSVTPTRTALTTLLVASLAGFVMYVVVSNGFFVVGRPLLIGLLPGLVAGLLSSDTALSAVAGANAIAFGFLVSPPAATQAADGRGWLLGVGLLAVLVSAVIAAVVVLLRKAGVKSWLIAAVGLVFIVATMWYGAIAVAGDSGLSGDAALVTALQAPVEPYPEMTDPEVYLFVHQRMAAGASYDAAWHEIITALGSRYEQSAPVKYRLPTLQWFWNLLPPTAWSLVVAALAFGTLAVGATYWFAMRLTTPPLGLIAAGAVAVLYLRIASGPYLLQYEGWAAALTLTALALGMESRCSSGRRAIVLMSLAAAAALLAALTRELATYFLLGALLAGVLDRRARQTWVWVPWTVALVVLIAAYVSHLSHLSSLGYLGGGGFSLPKDYSSPPKGHFAATLAYGTWLMGGLPWLPWLGYALALAGAFALRGWTRWTSLWAVAAPTAAFVLFSPITVSGNPAGYWGMLVTPLAFAIAPGAVLLLPSDVPGDLRGSCAKGLA